MAASNSFGHGNQGIQLVENSGTINVQVQAPPSPQKPSPGIFIPFSRNRKFVDRGDILDRIAKKFNQHQYHTRIAIVGLGGAGKSQLAIEYVRRPEAQRSYKLQPWIFWIDASTRVTFEQNFRAIADYVDLPGRNNEKADILQLVRRWLSDERNEEWMIVLDGADKRHIFYPDQSDSNASKDEVHLAEYLPQSHKGSILITTRDMDLARALTGDIPDHIFHIDSMTQEEAVKLLEGKLGRTLRLETARDLVEELDRIPLAIVQAAAYIQVHQRLGYSPETYLAEFQDIRKKSKFLQHPAHDLHRSVGESNAVLITWNVTFDYIVEKRPSAADLLSLMSFFEPQSIPCWALEPGHLYHRYIPYIWNRKKSDQKSTGHLRKRKRSESPHQNTIEDTTAPARPSSGQSQPDSTCPNTDDEFKTDLLTLLDYCLVSVNEAPDQESSCPDQEASMHNQQLPLSMHALVQFWTQRRLEREGVYKTFQQHFIKRMATVFPSPREYKNWTKCRALLPHIQKVFDYDPEEDVAEEWATLLYLAGLYLSNQGEYKLALQTLTKAENARKQRLGERHPQTLITRQEIASALRFQGKSREAEELEEVLEPNHPRTLATMGNLAYTWKHLGRHSEAIALMEECIQGRRRVLGENHPYTQDSLEALTEWRSEVSPGEGDDDHEVMSDAG
ncbi:hypothetical protein VTJ04DRAFT_5774 [Mycothermus thermophilus]|uniref:uncharacterized protein n=1 Tax=Humicola insolens TaxID=85995 RepID=UPI003742B586